MQSPLFAGDFYTTEEGEAARGRVFAEIDRLELRATTEQLHARGYAVIPPELGAPPGFADRVREALLEVAQLIGARPTPGPDQRYGSRLPDSVSLADGESIETAPRRPSIQRLDERVHLRLFRERRNDLLGLGFEPKSILKATRGK